MSTGSSTQSERNYGCIPERNSIRRVHRSQQTEPTDKYDAFIQTDLKIQDKYCLPAKELIRLAYRNWFRQVMDVKIHCIAGTKQKFFDLNTIRECFPDKVAFDKISPVFVHRFWDIFYQYSHQVCARQGIEDSNDIFFDLHGVNMGAIVDEFKSYNPFFNSTIPKTYTQWCHKPSAVKIDIIRELKFYRYYINGLPENSTEKFDISYYYMFLQSQKIPITELLANSKIVAQVGIDVNIPQLQDLITVLDKLSSTFASIIKPDVLDTMKARVAALLTSVYNIIRWCSSALSTQDLIVNLISSLITLFPTQKIMDCVNYIFSGVTAQSGFQLSSQAAIKAIFVCVFLVITSQLPGKNTIDGFIVRVKNIPQALKSIAQFHEMVDPIAKECVLFVEEHVMKLDVSASRVKTIDEVTRFSERVAELTEMHKRRQINKDPALAKEAGRLHYDAVRLLGRCINMNYDRQSIDFLRSLLPTTYKISESALASGADMNKIRRKPIVIWLAGQSQIGKTTLIMKLIQDIEKHSSTYFRENGELPQDWEKEIFTCCPENEYMDGYHGQNWVTMDEFNQMRDSIANPSAENFILLRAISQFPYLLHMAALHEKPNSYMSSHGFILTSNSTNIQPESIKTKEAITNRISCPYRMEVREEYRLYFDNNRKYKLDVGKVMRQFGTYTTDCYYFVEFDPYTEQDLPGYYTYEQVLWRMIDVYDRETHNFTEYSSFLDNNRSQPLPPRSTTQVYTPPPSSLDTSSDDEPRRPRRKNDYLREWRQPYTPAGQCRSDFADSPGLKYAKRALAQSGEDEYYDAESDYGDGFDAKDYALTPFWALPYELAWRTLGAPFVAFEQVCQRSERVSSWNFSICRSYRKHTDCSDS